MEYHIFLITHRAGPAGTKTRLAVLHQKIIFIFTTMQCKALLTFLIFTTSLLNAQNLVPNPSFEEYLECPYSTAEFHTQVVDWYSWQETPDYFHTCSNDFIGSAGVPGNAWGWQWPITGEAYAALATFAHHVLDIREYIAAPLIEPLVLGQEYYISFYASQFNGGVEWESWCATSNIGLRFFKDPIYSFGSNSTPLTPDNFAHLNYSEVLLDTMNWTLIEGWVTADDDYNWVAIGNFFNDNNTEVTFLNNEDRCFGFYYIENVCVATSPEACEYLLQPDTTSTVSEVSLPGVQVFPNPAQDVLQIFHNSGVINIVQVYDPVGKLISTSNNATQNISIETTHWSKGLYIILVEDENGKQKPFKIIKQ